MEKKSWWAPFFLLLGIWATFLVPFGLLIWTADRGLDTTDEASYILVAQNPWISRGHGTFFGFALHPLWILSGQHLASFRILGFFMGAGVGLIFARVLDLRLSQTTRLNGWIRGGLYGSILVASLCVYSNGIRTLSYNWLAWCGGSLFLASIFCPIIRGWRGWIWTAVGILGWLVLLLGKWGAAFMVAASVAALLFFPKNNRADYSVERSRLISVLLLGAFAAIVLGCGIGLSGLVDTINAGVFVVRQYQSHGFWLIPEYVSQLSYYAYRLGRAFVWIVPIGWLTWWGWKKVSGKKPNFLDFAPVVFLLATGLALIRGYGVGGMLTFTKESIISGGWWLGVLWVVWKSVGHFPKDAVPWRLVLICISIPFILGFGSNTSMADYAGRAALLTLAGGWFLAERLFPRIYPWAWLCIVLSASILQGTRIVTSLEDTYRVGSLWKQNKLLESGPEKDRLRVHPELAEFLSRFEDELRKAGFRAGTPVVGISDLCGVVYLAGGTSPGVPWYFGGQDFVKQYTVTVLAWLPEETLSKVWVFRKHSTGLPGDLASFWPPGTWVKVPHLVGKVSGLPEEHGQTVVEIYRPSL
jgi:hypothetical protein